MVSTYGGSMTKVRYGIYGGLLLMLAATVGQVSAQADEDLETRCEYFADQITLEDFEDMVEACTALIDQGDGSYDIFLDRGYAYGELGENQAAYEDYTKALLYYGKSSIAYNNRGFALSQLESDEAAILDYSRAILLDPSYVQAYINRAYSYINLGEYEQAEADANAVLDLDSASVPARRVLVEIAQASGDTEGAVELITEIIEQVPNEPNNYLVRAFIYWQEGDFEAAAPDYWEWVQLNAPNAEPLGAQVETLPFEESVELETGLYFTLTFEAEAGDLLTAEAIAETATVDPVLIVLDEDGNAITSDDDTGLGIGELDALISGYELPEDGTYTLILGYAGGGDNGEVQLTVESE